MFPFAFWKNGDTPGDGNTTFLANFNQNPPIDYGINNLGSGTVGGSSSISSAQAKFGASSAYIPSGSTSAYSVMWPTPPQLGAGNFTVEFQWRPDAITHVGLFSYDDGGGSNKPIAYIGGPSGNAWRWQVAAANIINTTIANSPTVGAWNHICWMRSSGTLYLFVEGVVQASGSDSTNYNGTNTTLYVGNDTQDAISIKGYVDDFRISNIARYSTSGFTPPTGPF